MHSCFDISIFSRKYFWKSTHLILQFSKFFFNFMNCQNNNISLHFDRKNWFPQKKIMKKKIQMFAMIEICKQWKNYFENATHQIRVIIDHVNLKSFFIIKILNRRKTRWWKKLLKLNFLIKYRAAKIKFREWIFKTLKLRRKQSKLFQSLYRKKDSNYEKKFREFFDCQNVKFRKKKHDYRYMFLNFNNSTQTKKNFETQTRWNFSKKAVSFRINN